MKGQTFRFTLGWIFVSTEFQIVFLGVGITNVKHLLKSFWIWSKKEAVIAVSSDAKEDTVYPATISTSSQELKESIHIKTVEKSREDRTLTDAISQAEDAGVLAIPTNIGELINVDEDQEPNEDDRESSSEEFLEEEGMLYKVESLGHVHHAAVDTTSIPEEITDCLNDCPRTHVARYTWLIGKLEIIYSNRDTKQDNDDPIK